jgi:hypothetical protein
VRVARPIEKQRRIVIDGRMTDVWVGMGKEKGWVKRRRRACVWIKRGMRQAGRQMDGVATGQQEEDERERER